MRTTKAMPRRRSPGRPATITQKATWHWRARLFSAVMNAMLLTCLVIAVSDQVHVLTIL